MADTYEVHEAAKIFPLDEERLDGLTEDIQEHGLSYPIETLDGKILDGRRRWEGCKRAKVKPRFVEVQTDDPVAYVLSANLHRRHLDESQRAMVGARVHAHYAKDAKERQKKGKGIDGSGGRGHKKTFAPIGAEVSPPKFTRGGRASNEAGQSLNVSAQSVDRARQILQHGIDELATLVDSRKVSVTAAARVAFKVPKGRQKELAAEGPDAIRKESTKLAKKRKPRKRVTELELIKSVKADIKRMISAMKANTRGLSDQRERVITNLRLAIKYVAGTSSFFK